MNCPECGWSIRERLHFCPNCGAALRQVELARRCPHCQAELKGSVTVCAQCGQEVEPARAALRPVSVRTARPRPSAEEVVPARPAPRPIPVRPTRPRPSAEDVVPTRPAAEEKAARSPAPVAAVRLGQDAARAQPQRRAAEPAVVRPLVVRPLRPTPAVVAWPRPQPRPARWLVPLAVVGLLAAGTLAVALVAGLHPGDLRLPRLASLPSLGSVLRREPTAVPTTEPTLTPTPTVVPTETPIPTATPEPTSTPVPPTPAPLVHTVRSGESLQAIARQYGVTVADLAAANGISVNATIHVGQQLVIPGQFQPAPSGEPTMHVVQAGENLVLIAGKYGVSVTALMAANELKQGDLIKVGQVLKIPLPGAQAAPTATAAPTETPAPTQTPTIAPTAEATPGATPGATAALEFPAPNLLSPANGAEVKGAEDVLLNWTSVGLLGDDTWYVIKIWRDDPAAPTPSAGYTRTTAWRIPASFQPPADAASRRFFWSVTVMRVHEGQQAVPVSPQSEARSFDWK